MEIPKEIIDKLADEVFKELEETASKEGRNLTFDDMEKAILMYRQRIGERLMQATTDRQVSGASNQKKTVHAAMDQQEKKGTRKKR